MIKYNKFILRKKMFDLQNENRSKVIIPGYTGHLPAKEDDDESGNHETGFYIPGIIYK